MVVARSATLLYIIHGAAHSCPLRSFPVQHTQDNLPVLGCHAHEKAANYIQNMAPNASGQHGSGYTHDIAASPHRTPPRYTGPEEEMVPDFDSLVLILGTDWLPTRSS